jgi:hypothetical protein
MTEEGQLELEMLEELRAFVSQMAELENVFGACAAISRYGQAFSPRTSPTPWLRMGEARDCFNNATRYAAVRDDVVYAEGYALEPGLPVPVHHAWLIDADGHVIDPTWKETADHVYFGIPFKQKFLRELLERNGGQAGILVNLHLLRASRRQRVNFEEIIVAGIAPLR